MNGGGGIRTRGRALNPTGDFESPPLDHSGTPPSSKNIAQKICKILAMRLLNQDRVRRVLESMYNKGRVPNTILFWGPSGVGKTVAALDFGKGLLCRKGVMWGCGECESCRVYESITDRILKGEWDEIKYYGESQSGRKIFLYLKGEHPDFIFLIPDGHVIKIDQVRAVKEFAWEKPVLSPAKLIIVEGADLLNPQAGDAFLKSLEEPPYDTFFIMTAVNIKNILPTIISRSFVIEFGPLDFESFREITGIDDKEMYELSGGSVSRLNKLREKASVREMVNKFLEGDASTVFSCIQKIGSYNEDDVVLFFDLLEESIVGKMSTNVEMLERVIDVIDETRKDIPKGVNVTLAIAYIKTIIGG